MHVPPEPDEQIPIRIKIKRGTTRKLRLIKSYHELKNYDATIQFLIAQNCQYRDELEQWKNGAKTAGSYSVLLTDNREAENYNSDRKITMTIEDRNFDINRSHKLPSVDLRDGW